MATDIRNDLIDDGMVSLADGEYPVHPRIVEAITKYPSFYFAGAVGPDGYHDLIFGQQAVHPDSSGVWFAHVLDKAWEVQDSDDYTPEEKLQALAWAYGFPTHGVADIFAHNLVNELNDGPFPDFANVLGNDIARANAIRHFIIEAYIGDATPKFDGIKEVVEGEVEREQLPTGDVSNTASAERSLDAPIRFIFDSLMADMPDLPGHQEAHLTTLTDSVPGLIGDLNGSVVANLRGVVNSRLLESNLFLEPDATVEVVSSGTLWRVTSNFDELIVRADADANGNTVLHVRHNVQTRGKVADFFLGLRGRLVRLRETLGGPTATIAEPFADVIDSAVANGDAILRGDDSADFGQLFDDLKSLGEQLIQDADALFAGLANQDDVTDDDLLDYIETVAGRIGTTAANYIQYWLDNIDDGLRNYSKLGHAVSETFFDPEAKRTLQNKEGRSFGPDAVEPDFLDRRADAEAEPGLLSLLTNRIDDPNSDGITDDSFVNEHLIGMLGIPSKFGELREGVQRWIDEVDELVIEPTREILGDINPLDPLLEWIEDKIVEYLESLLRDYILERFQIDIDVVDFLLDNPTSLMDVASIDFGASVQQLFTPTDHERLDLYLGFEGKDHLRPFQEGLGTDVFDNIMFYDGARSGLKDNVEFDKQEFAAYANSVTFGKLMLLQEELVNESPVAGDQPKVLSRLMSDLVTDDVNDGSNYFYDYATHQLNGNHGGNILTTTMANVSDQFGQSVDATTIYEAPVDGNLWITSIDTDHTWRQDSRTQRSLRFRFHKTGTGDNQTSWVFNGIDNGTYRVQTDWLLNNLLTDQGNSIPSSQAPYTIQAGGSSTTVLVDQKQFPNDEIVFPEFPDVELAGQAWHNLAEVTVNDGTLRVTLSDDDGNNGVFTDDEGTFVVAGRVRIVPINGTPGDPKVIENTESPTGDRQYIETAPALFSYGVDATYTLAQSLADAATLDSGAMPQALLDMFVQDTQLVTVRVRFYSPKQIFSVAFC